MRPYNLYWVRGFFMRHRSFIFVAVTLLLLIAGSIALYAYDSSNEDTVANGVTAAGVDVGGLTADQARERVQAKIVTPLEKPVAVSSGKRRFTLSAKDAGVKVDVGGMVDEAVRESRRGSIFSRVLRDATGGEENAAVEAKVSYSKLATARLVSRVGKAVDRSAKDATVEFPSLQRAKEHDGVRVNEGKLRADLATAITNPDIRTVKASTSVTKPKVTRDQLASKYPTVLVLQRASFQLKLYKDLKLKKTYTVAVGQVGLETPAGLYHIQNKGVNVPWNVPKSAWAGDLAGTTVPGGAPDNPLKARWLGIFNGAGIHGTDELSSLGSAASHGCVRMAIPDVIDLYPQVPVQTPIYIA
jgi:lipoprotein-anchoring transpeptidase ErfK/SrfK